MDIHSGILAVLAFGFLLGLKHATDADHVVAVANIVRKERNIWQSIWLGASWGAGHSVPLLILGAVILIIKDVALQRYETVAPYLELGVGIMLIYLGISAAWNVLRGKLHMHQHDHGAGPHVHVHASHQSSESHRRAKNLHNSFFFLGKPVFRAKSFAIGIVHGLAGSAAVMVALLPTIDSTLDRPRLHRPLQHRHHAIHGRTNHHPRPPLQNLRRPPNPQPSNHPHRRRTQHRRRHDP